jgi:hypothetical protein
MGFWKFILSLSFIGAWLGGWVLYADIANKGLRERNAQDKRDLADLSIPPKGKEPDGWTIAYWVSVDKKSSDCVTADEYMDKNAISKTVKRRGAVIRTYFLTDYVESCRQRVKGALELGESQKQVLRLFRLSPRFL